MGQTHPLIEEVVEEEDTVGKEKTSQQQTQTSYMHLQTQLAEMELCVALCVIKNHITCTEHQRAAERSQTLWNLIWALWWTW